MQKTAKQSHLELPAAQEQIRIVVLNVGLLLEGVLTRTSFTEAGEYLISWTSRRHPCGQASKETPTAGMRAISFE